MRTECLPDDYWVVLAGDMITEEALPTYMAMLNTLDGVRDETVRSSSYHFPKSRRPRPLDFVTMKRCILSCRDLHACAECPKVTGGRCIFSFPSKSTCYEMCRHDIVQTCSHAFGGQSDQGLILPFRSQ